MQSTDDLNLAADGDATLYDEFALLTSEGLDGTNFAAGGEPVTLTYGAAGVEGPTSEQAAIDGVAWSNLHTFTLAEQASYVGLLRGGVVHNTDKLPRSVGPGSVPYSHGIGPGAA